MTFYSPDLALASSMNIGEQKFSSKFDMRSLSKWLSVGCGFGQSVVTFPSLDKNMFVAN